MAAWQAKMVNRRSILAGAHERHPLTRREMMQAVTAILASGVVAPKAHSEVQGRQEAIRPTVAQLAPYDSAVLPPAIRSRFVNNGNGLRMHVLEAGVSIDPRRCVVLLHGFPELAYSWRNVMPALAAAGFHVIAP